VWNIAEPELPQKYDTRGFSFLSRNFAYYYYYYYYNYYYYYYYYHIRVCVVSLKPRFMDANNFVCVLYRMLISASVPRCACFSPNSTSLVFAGMVRTMVNLYTF
jgi:hypothetical protein